MDKAINNTILEGQQINTLYTFFFVTARFIELSNWDSFSSHPFLSYVFIFTFVFICKLIWTN